MLTSPLDDISVGAHCLRWAEDMRGFMDICPLAAAEARRGETHGIIFRRNGYFVIAKYIILK